MSVRTVAALLCALIITVSGCATTGGQADGQSPSGGSAVQSRPKKLSGSVADQQAQLVEQILEGEVEQYALVDWLGALPSNKKMSYNKSQHRFQTAPYPNKTEAVWEQVKSDIRATYGSGQDDATRRRQALGMCAVAFTGGSLHVSTVQSTYYDALERSSRWTGLTNECGDGVQSSIAGGGTVTMLNPSTSRS